MKPGSNMQLSKKSLAEELANRFVKNFVKFTGNEEGKKLVAAGPKVK